MQATNKRLTILSEAEQAALYEIPDFDDVQRLNYLNLTPEEQTLMRSRSTLAAKVYCAIQIGYFKAKHLLFSFTWEEVEEDVNFVMQEYFPEEIFHPDPVTKHQHYAQCQHIASHFDYKLWSKEFESSLHEKGSQILQKDTTPQFIVIELLAWLREKKIMRPKYTTLQLIVSHALNEERNRIIKIVKESLTEEDKASLKNLLFEDKTETLTGLADLKQDTKDFKARMITDERNKMLEIKPLYQLSTPLLSKLKLSNQNIQYYASLIDYYDNYDLRKKIKPELTYLYLLCYINQRYLKLNDNLIDAFDFHLKHFEEMLKKDTREAYAKYAIDKQEEAPKIKKLIKLFVKKELSDQTSFGEVRKEAFDIMSEEEILKQIGDEAEVDLKPIDFQWKAVDTSFHRFKLQLRPLMMAIDFSSDIADSPWIAAITWLKEIFQGNKKINQYPVTKSPEKTRPKRLKKHLLYIDAK